jgi:sortase A
MVFLVIGGLLWWQQDLAVAISQGRLEARFSERLSMAAEGIPLETTIPDEPADETPDPPQAVLVGEGGDDPRFAAPPPTTTPTTIPEVESASLPPVLRELAPAEGEPIGRIEIPAIELDWVVVEGVEKEDLDKGPGHMPWTPVPGQIGNAGISGHRTTHGAPFNRIDLLEPGDEIHVTTLTGTHVYEVIGSLVVLPDDVWVSLHRDGAWLTLTTCNPKGSSRERLVVFGKLVEGPNLDAVRARYEGIEYSVPAPPEDA